MKLKYFIYILICVLFSLDSFSQQSKIYLEKGYAAARQKNHEQAIEFFEIGIQFRDELLFNHYYEKGYCLYIQKQYEKAEEAFRIGLKIDSKNPNFNFIKGNSWWGIGRIYGRKGDYEKEIESYKNGLNYVQDPDLYNNLGFAYIAVDSLELALENLSICLKKDKDNPFGYNNRAWLLIKLKKYDLAIKDLKKSESLMPNNPYLHRNYGMYYIGINDPDEACKSLKKAQNLGYERIADEVEKDVVQNLIKKHCLQRGIRG